MIKDKKVLNKIIYSLLIVAILIVSFPITSKANLNSSDRNKVANFAKAFIEEGNRKGILAYSRDYSKRTAGFNNTLVDGKIYMDCSAFAAFVYNHTCNLNLPAYSQDQFLTDSNFSDAYQNYVDANGNKRPLSLYEVKRASDYNINLELGDLILVYGHHIGVYVGDGLIAHFANPNTGAAIASLQGGFFNGASGSASGKSQDVLDEEEKSVTTYVLRLKTTVDSIAGFEEYVWPSGEGNSTWQDENLNEDFSYDGVSRGEFGVRVFNLGWIINSLKEILDWFIGIVTYIVRAIIVGLTTLMEDLPGYIITLVTDQDSSFTIDKIIFNKVDLLNVNFFNLKTAVGGVELSESSIVYIIRSNIAKWYYIIRYTAIIGLLITLIYIGIRMALSSIAEQKAKYKKLLRNWVVSFIIVFGIHYFMLAVLEINEEILNLIANIPVGEQTLYDTIRSQAYAIPASIGWRAAVMYVILVVLMYIFLFKYVKRFAVVAILTLLAPIMGIGYAIDKIKDDKSQYLDNWVKEYVFNVIIQVVHALLYTVFVTIAFDMMGSSIMGVTLAIVLIIFMFKAEGIFKKIFGIKSGMLKDLREDGIIKFAKLKAQFNLAKGIVQANTKAVGFVSKPVGVAVDKVNENRIRRKIDKINSKNEELLSKTDENEGLQKDLENSADRMKEYRNVGAYDQLAMEHSKYNEILDKINSNKNDIKELEKFEDETVKINGKKLKNSDIKELQEAIGNDMNKKDFARALYKQTGGNVANKIITGYKKGKQRFKAENERYKELMQEYKEAKRRIKLERIASGKVLTAGVRGSIINAATFGVLDAANMAKTLKNEAKNQPKELETPKYNPIVEYIPENTDTFKNQTIVVTLKRGVGRKYNEFQQDIVTKEGRKESRESKKILEKSFNVLSENSSNEFVSDMVSEKTLAYKDLNKVVKSIKKRDKQLDDELITANMTKELRNKAAEKTNKNIKDITEKDINEMLEEYEVKDIYGLLQNSGVTDNKLAKEIQKVQEAKMTKEDINTVIDDLGESTNFYLNSDNLKQHLEDMLKQNISKQEGKDIKEIVDKDIDKEIQRLGKDSIAKLIKMASLNNDVVLDKKYVNNDKYKSMLNDIEKIKKQQFIIEESKDKNKSNAESTQNIIRSIEKRKGK